MIEVKFGTELLEDIESTRKSMIQAGASFGLAHPETIELSQRLDQLLNKFDHNRTFQ